MSLRLEGIFVAYDYSIKEGRLFVNKNDLDDILLKQKSFKVGDTTSEGEIVSITKKYVTLTGEYENTKMPLTQFIVKFI